MPLLTTALAAAPTILAGGKALYGWLNGEESPRDPYGGQRTQLIQEAMQNATGPATSTPYYQEGKARLYDALRRRQDQDARQAAARGLAGSEYEIAQSAQRGRQQSRGMSNLRQGAARQQDRSFGRALQAVQSGTRQANMQDELRRRREAATWRGLGSAAQNAAMAYFFSQQGGQGQTGQENPWDEEVGVGQSYYSSRSGPTDQDKPRELFGNSFLGMG